jgi:hypothetical protein
MRTKGALVARGKLVSGTVNAVDVVPEAVDGVISKVAVVVVDAPRFFSSSSETVPRNRPVYAPRLTRSSSVSPGWTLSRLCERIDSPKTKARCSFLSILFSYMCRKYSDPSGVGILARAVHHATGEAEDPVAAAVVAATVLAAEEERVESGGVAGGVL